MSMFERFAFQPLFFFFGPVPSALFMGHEQYIKAYEQCFLV